jgi:aspartokinase/homoserine dehydrogenase 1
LQGIHIVTPNKKLGSGPLQQYQAVKKIGRESYIHFFYEARPTGAASSSWVLGLPVVGICL